MPTQFRNIIMLGEMIGLFLFSIYRCKNIYDENYKTGFIKVCIYYAIWNILTIYIYVFSFKSLIPQSYNKLITLSIVVFCSLMPFISLSIYTKHEILGTILLIFFIINLYIFFLVFADNDFVFPFETCIKEEGYIERVDPTLHLTEKSKIGYYVDDFNNTKHYVFFYQDSNDNWYYVDEPIEDINTCDISTNSSYVEKSVSRRTYRNDELFESDENYITTREDVSYRIYYNPNELIEIKK